MSLAAVELLFCFFDTAVPVMAADAVQRVH
jgi:hypothetical protein